MSEAARMNYCRNIGVPQAISFNPRSKYVYLSSLISGIIDSTMAKQQRTFTATARSRQQARGPQWHFPMSRTNFIYFGIALAVIVIGFGLMATGISTPETTTPEKWGNPMALAIGPILLVIGFCVLVPYAIMKRDRTESSGS